MNKEFDIFVLNSLFSVIDGHLIRKQTTSSKATKGRIAGCVSSKGYIQVVIEKRRVMAHRVVWAICNQQNIPDSYEIDHVNQCKSDNRIENLRLATRSQNAANIKSKKQFKGVYFEKERNKWVAVSKMEKKNYKIGRYESQLEAAKAYDDYVKKHYGEFGVFNF